MLSKTRQKLNLKSNIVSENMKYSQLFLLRLLLMVSLCELSVSRSIVDGDIDIDLTNFALGAWDDSQQHPKWNPSHIKYHIKSSDLKPYNTNIRTAFNQIEDVSSCLRFTEVSEYSEDSEMIVFESSGSGCHSQIGRQRGKPTFINLDLDPSKNCTDVKVVKHEVGHALGFIHW